MRGEFAREFLRKHQVRSVERAAGTPTSLLGMAASRQADAQIDNPGMLPVTEVDADIQDESTGDFYFLLDYSSFGGGDILR